jgi:hypothetical protein
MFFPACTIHDASFPLHAYVCAGPWCRPFLPPATALINAALPHAGNHRLLLHGSIEKAASLFALAVDVGWCVSLLVYLALPLWVVVGSVLHAAQMLPAYHFVSRFVNWSAWRV